MITAMICWAFALLIPASILIFLLSHTTRTRPRTILSLMASVVVDAIYVAVTLWLNLLMVDFNIVIQLLLGIGGPIVFWVGLLFVIFSSAKTK